MSKSGQLGRMTDFGKDDAEITFDLGSPATEAEIEEVMKELEELVEE